MGPIRAALEFRVILYTHIKQMIRQDVYKRQVYGFGALLVIFLLSPFAGNPILLFLAAVVVTSLLEYMTGWALEAL